MTSDDVDALMWVEVCEAVERAHHRTPASSHSWSEPVWRRGITLRWLNAAERRVVAT